MAHLRTPSPLPPPVSSRTVATVGSVAESAVQRVADASVWLLFRLNGVRS